MTQTDMAADNRSREQKMRNLIYAIDVARAALRDGVESPEEYLEHMTAIFDGHLEFALGMPERTR